MFTKFIAGVHCCSDGLIRQTSGFSELGSFVASFLAGRHNFVHQSCRLLKVPTVPTLYNLLLVVFQ